MKNHFLIFITVFLTCTHAEYEYPEPEIPFPTPSNEYLPPVETTTAAPAPTTRKATTTTTTTPLPTTSKATTTTTTTEKPDPNYDPDSNNFDSSILIPEPVVVKTTTEKLTTAAPTTTQPATTQPTTTRPATTQPTTTRPATTQPTTTQPITKSPTTTSLSTTTEHEHHDHDEVLFWDFRESIPGEPGQDYPILDKIPSTEFKCNDRLDGYYADLDAGCQVFHICSKMPDDSYIQSSFLCPNGTIFQQETFSCQWWADVECASSTNFYELNSKIGVVPEANP